MSKRKRGTRRIVGYVVSLTGKRGGPYVQNFHSPGERFMTDDRAYAEEQVTYAKRLKRPDARVLPVVRYELDREEERLRDAVVEAAAALIATRGAEPRIWHAYGKLEDVSDALRAHLEKKG